MFAVMVDHKLRDYRDKIAYSIDYIFTVLGYNYRILADDEYAKVEEIPFMYVSDKKIVEDYLSDNPRGFAICILHDPIHYNYENLGRADIKQLLKSFNIGHDIPYLCSREIVEPISFTCDSQQKRFYVGVFHFDLIGNIYFHLTGREQNAFNQRDPHKQYLYQQSNFEKFMSYPYLTGMINLVELFLGEGENYLRYPLMQKPVWPGNKQYAVTISHNVDKLTKWNWSTFWGSFFYWFRSFWRVKYHLRNFWGLLRYLFDNWEPYWNFDLISGLEHDNGIRSTYFFGVNYSDKPGVDYDLNDEDQKKQKNELQAFGHDFGLFLSGENAEEKIATSLDKLTEFTTSKIKGVRKANLLTLKEEDILNSKDSDLVWDSSLTMPDLQGFVNGIGYPYFIIPANINEGTLIELPVNFSDQALLNGKISLTRDALEEKIEDMIDKARKFRSLLVFNFSLYTFEEILLLSEIYKWLMERLKGDPSVWKARLSEISNWLEQRSSVKVHNKRDLVEIEIGRDIDEITLYLKGLWRVTEILERKILENEQEELDLFTENTWWQLNDAEVMVTGRMLKVRNAKSGCRIRIETEKFG
ncbi:MAG: hypothetical protein RAO94_06285 [Candidatus Stygibacter australis]|nr:hypothetical protein [Candidatus Stygibacter australis]MDP8321939.1 hypothetical protein [Candidatus Stygibacter australis]